MANKIRLLLAGDKASLDALIPILKADNQIVIVGVAASAQETIHQQKELKADVLLVSQTVTQKNVHIQNLTELVELLEAEGIREKVVLVGGGPRISHELAKELGYDAGFGAGKYADDVATFAVTDMVKRGFK
mgnify:CR=1 FL=1